MNKYEIFLSVLEDIDYAGDLPKEYYEVLNEIKSQSLSLKEKPLFTESGLQILEYLQSVGTNKMKASDIAQGMGVSSRKVSGAIRKLVTDDFVEKFGSNPVIYSLTDKGKNFDLTTYKKEITSNEEDD